MSESENRPEETTTVQPKPYDYKDLSQEAPLTIDPKENDYTEEADKLDPVYTLKFTEPDLMDGVSVSHAQRAFRVYASPLRELGQKLTPPLSRSGVNHRLEKIIDLAARKD